MRVYQHSGTVPISGAAYALAVGAAAAAVLGVVYSFTFYYIPYPYLNFLLAIGFGALTGYIVGWGAREGMIRNTPVVGGIALLATLVGIYTEWGSTIYAMYPPAELPQLWRRAGLAPFLPHNILILMVNLFDKGSWGLADGTTVHGWPLVALWLIEAGTILALAVSTAAGRIANHPFCEKCQKWIAGQTPHLYVGDGTEPVWSEIQHGTFENLAQTPHASGCEETFVRLMLSVCDGCTESNYLTITACRHKTNAKGHRYLEETKLITNLVLQSAQAEIIEAARSIAPGVGELSPLLAANAGNWTLQPSGPASVAGASALELPVAGQNSIS